MGFNGFVCSQIYLALINSGKPHCLCIHWLILMFPMKIMETQPGSSEASVAPSPQRKVEASATSWRTQHTSRGRHLTTSQCAAETVRQCIACMACFKDVQRSHRSNLNSIKYSLKAFRFDSVQSNIHFNF